MDDAGWVAPAWVIRWEGVAIAIACAASLVSVPIGLGELGLSWDALNHHIYLGWTAERPRFDTDVLAASYQSFQYPYLYWPIYKLAVGGASGAMAGAALAFMNSFAAPPLWAIAKRCIPGTAWADVATRALSVVLAFLSPVVLSLIDSTANDTLAAIPFVWALAFAMHAFGEQSPERSWRHPSVFASGLFAGVSVACKLSNGPLVLLLPAMWVIGGKSCRNRWRLLLIGCISTAAGFAAAYAYWGWQLWIHVGNPVYPFCDDWFAGLRALTGWHQ